MAAAAAAGFFDAAAFLGAFGLEAFFAAAGFFVAVDFGFFGVVVLLVFGFAAFFVAVFLAPPAGFAAPVFFALVCVGFLVFVADLVVADFGLAALVVFAFFGFAAAVVVVDEVEAAGVDDVAELFVLAAVAAFFAGLVPADFDRERFFVAEPVDVDELDFFGFVAFFFLATLVAFSFNLNEPLAPLPLVCLNDLDFTPFLRADLRCWLA